MKAVLSIGSARVRVTRSGGKRKSAAPTPRTPHQLRIARFMREYHAKYGYWPLLSDIAEFMGISKVTVHEHLKSLVTQGVVIRNESKRSARAYAVADGVKLPDGGPTRSELIGLLNECRAYMAGKHPDSALLERIREAIEHEESL